MVDLDILPVKQVEENKEACLLRWHFFHLCSTNSKAWEIQNLYTLDKMFYVLADQQTSGRGRLGRVWQSPLGNLYLTVGLPIINSAKPFPLSHWSLLAALAVHRTIIKLCTIPTQLACFLQLKWPNDIICTLPGREGIFKLGGILLENRICNDLTWLMIGIGLNLHTPPSEATNLPAMTVAEFCQHLDLPPFSATTDEWSETLAAELQVLQSIWQHQGLAGFEQELMSAFVSVGQKIYIRLNDGNSLQGIFVGFRLQDGALYIRLPETGSIHAVTTGEIENYATHH